MIIYQSPIALLCLLVPNFGGLAAGDRPVARSLVEENPVPADVETRRHLTNARAFSVEDIASQETLDRLHGTKLRKLNTLEVGELPEGEIIVNLLIQYIQEGGSIAEVASFFQEHGYSEEAVKNILEEDADAHESFDNLMETASQIETIASIPDATEGAVPGDDTQTDLMGNQVNEGVAARAKHSTPRGGAHAGLRKKVDRVGMDVRTKSSTTQTEPRCGAFNAGWGSCSTYAPGGSNDGWCDEDYDSCLGVYASNACDECAICGEFDAGYGPCSTYAPGGSNDGWCDSDYDSCLDVYASDACDECAGECAPKEIVLQNFGSGKGPGFRFRNTLPIPVEVSVWQVGPLYWKLLQPGQYWDVGTGAVWFTVKAEVRYDGEPKIDVWDAILPILVIVGSIALALVTMGAASAVSASVAAGSVAASTATSVASVLVGMGMKAGVALWVVKAGVVGATTALSATGATKLVTEAIEGDLGFAENEDYHYWTKGGVYAGYAWPFEQERQRIDIVGGLSMYPAEIEGVGCENVVDQPASAYLSLKCVGGSCSGEFD